MVDEKKTNIENVGPSYENVLDYVLNNKYGAYDENLRQKLLEGRFGRPRCDVLDGSCSCGSWHHLNDFVKD